MSALLPGAGARPTAPLVLLLALATCAPDPGAELARALEAAPGVAPRLSTHALFRPCAEETPPSGTVVRAVCPALRPAASGRISQRFLRVAAGSDPTALQRQALLGVVRGDETGKSLDRSISSLRQAAAAAERPAPMLADLAAALVVRAERAQSPRDLLEANETVEEALAREPALPAALFNRALALDRLGLVDEAAQAWRAYLTADPASGWADEARRRLGRLRALAPLAPPDGRAPPEAYARYAAADPQGARELGMDRLLGEWGAAVEAGDAARADDRLRRVAALGKALERRPGGDASLADAVRAIRAAEDDAGATRALARAHREYAAARRLFDAPDYQAAQPRFAAAAAAADASPALRGWARAYLGTSRAHNRDTAGAVRTLECVVSAADGERHPALAARARWSLGNILARGERWEAALAHAGASARLFAAAGERENEGGALNVLVAVHFVLGEPDSAYAALHRGLDRLRPHRASVRLHSLLAGASRSVAADGLHRSALRLAGEDVAVAARGGSRALEAEARLARARLLALGGEAAEARREMAAAAARVRALTPGVERSWMEADLREVEAMVTLRDDPARATTALDAAAAYFAPIPMRALPALVGAAEARLAAGDARGARERLDTVVALLDRRRDSIRMEPRRAAVFESARTVVDRLATLQLAAGRAAEALATMDRGRASLAPAGAAGRSGDDGVRAPAGEVALEYALVADTLLAWTVAGRRVEPYRSVVDTARLARTLDGVERLLEGRAADNEVRPALTGLYDLLVRPLEGRLGGAGTPLVVIADGLLASVPFAALYDARRERYLVEAHPVRFAASLREARRRPEAAPARGVLFVADPAFDRREHAALDRLAHAGGEVRAAAGGYAGAAVLEGPTATRGALEAGLAGAGVVHFAGHAVFDDARPERSYLVLAPGGGKEAAGRITAAELSRRDLRHVGLVVLSACRTVRTGRGRAAGFTGLSGALLAAGAHGAVGSTWDVDDRLTAALMAAFHRRYRDSRNGPRALREAQLDLLGSRDPALRSPAAWAGFRYAGQ